MRLAIDRSADPPQIRRARQLLPVTARYRPGVLLDSLAQWKNEIQTRA